MKNTKLQEILDEQKFPYLGMTKEERDSYLNIVKKCKDICDTDNKIGNNNKCEIVEMSLEKENNKIDFNGSLTINDEDLRENRCIDGELFLEKDKIIVDMHITRLLTKDKHKEYRVLDEFSIKGSSLNRRSQYNYDMKSVKTKITDEEIKGRLK